jgi:hypothetical protein
MAGPFDKINSALTGKNDGHTTSGMDAAMQKHADEIHPVNGVGKSDQKFPTVVKKPPGGWALKLPSDDQ